VIGGRLNMAIVSKEAADRLGWFAPFRGDRLPGLE
jgi:hypothetical protein